MFFYLQVDQRRLKAPLGFEENFDAEKYRIAAADGAIRLFLQRRQAFPGTYCVPQQRSLTFGYGDPAITTGEFLAGEVHIDGSVTIRRDMFITLPIFYGYQDSVLTISDDYNAVVKAVQHPTANVRHILNLLSGRDTAMPSETIFNEVRILGERETLVLDGTLKVVPAADRPWRTSKELSRLYKAGDFRAVLDECFSHFVRTRLSGQHFALQVSGGLDSSTLPVYMKTHTTVRPPLCTVVYPNEEYRESQLNKITELQRLLQTSLITAELSEQRPPLHNAAATSDYVFEQAGPYNEAFGQLAAQLKSVGVSVLATGFGADELFEGQGNPQLTFGYGAPERDARAHWALPTYCTLSFRAQYVVATPMQLGYAMPLHSRSLLRQGPAFNAALIEHDVWPVSPFAEPALYEFCQGLPDYLKSEKTILRAYHQAYGSPTILYASPNEDFSAYFNGLWGSGMYTTLLVSLAQGSVTQRLGLIDMAGLLAHYKTLQAGPASDFFALHQWAAIEMNLQKAGL